jgi:NTE family protein
VSEIPLVQLGAAMPMATRPRVAVVIGAGGIKCTAAVGLWKVLEREGIPVDVVVGCSGGSMYAAGMALGFDAADAEQYSHRMWSEFPMRRLRFRSILRGLLPGRIGFREHHGLLDDRAVGRNMRRLFGDLSFAQTRIPLHIAATDLRTGERVELRSGSIFDAVRASIAIPLLLPPWPLDGRLLVDGGVSDPLPISIAIREGADVILAMGFESAIRDQLDSVLGVVGQTTSIAINHLLRSTYSFYSAVHHAEILPIMPSFDQPIRLGDAHLVPHIIEQGARAAEEALPYLQRLLGAAAAERSVP